MKVLGNLAEVVKTPAQSRPSCLPTGPGVAADNDLCFPGTKCSLCPPCFNGGGWTVFSTARPPLPVINHRVKSHAGAAERPRGGGGERGAAGRQQGPPGGRDAPGQSASVGSK